MSHEMPLALHHATPSAPDVNTMEEVLFELRRMIVGQDRLLERLLVALLARGHVLLEGVPGLAKTATIKALATVVGGSFGRIQFTPDLVPSDLIGTRIFTGTAGSFSTELGPVFANLVLADEINRASAKVQSALLEVMQEHQVTIGKETFAVPEPFLVLATQNPIESDGTYLLPEAQLDRFMFKVLVDYPSYDEEVIVVQRVTGPSIQLRTLLDAGQSAGAARNASTGFTWTRVSSHTPRRSSTRRVSPRHVQTRRAGRRDSVRRQPSRVHQPDRRCACPGVRARSLVRAAPRCGGPRARGAAPSPRALLRECGERCKR